MSSSLTAVLLGALQGTLAVLLTTYAGYLAASPRLGLLDRPTVARISRLGSSLFLPALIISSTGPQLTVKSIARLWIMLVWAVLSSAIAHGIGWAGQKVLGLEHWTILAAGRANSNALPLLLLESLKSTGVLDVFEMEGSNTLQRARTIVLLNSIVYASLFVRSYHTLTRIQAINHYLCPRPAPAFAGQHQILASGHARRCPPPWRRTARAWPAHRPGSRARRAP